MSNSLWPPWVAACQTSLSFTVSRSLLRFMVMISSHLILYCTLFLLPQSFPASGSFPLSLLFVWGSQNIGAPVSVLPMNIQDWFPLGWLVWSSYSPGYSQESSPTSQYESINSLVPSLLYNPTLAPVHDYWKNHSFDYTDLCWQSNVSAF